VKCGLDWCFANAEFINLKVDRTSDDALLKVELWNYPIGRKYQNHLGYAIFGMRR